MEKPESRKKWLKRKLLSRYRLVILNEESFEEQLYFRLTRLNVIIISTFLFSLLLVEQSPWWLTRPSRNTSRAMRRQK